MEDLQFKSIPFEIKASSADGATFEGKASPFWNIDSYGEIVDDKAFDQDLPDFMADGFIGGLNHDWDNPIGKPAAGTMAMPDHLHIKGSVIDTTHGMDVRKLLKAGIVKKLSIGYRTMGDMILNNADECMAYWEKKGYKPNAQDMSRCQMGARVLTRIKLFEVSPVTVPANDLAVITAVKAAREAAAKALSFVPPSEPVSESTEEPASAVGAAVDAAVIPVKFTSLSEAEASLREAGMSRTEAKTYISRLKALLRDAASDDAGTPPEGNSPEPVEPSVEAPEPDASATLDAGQEVKADEVDAVTPAPTLAAFSDFEVALEAALEDAPLSKELADTQRMVRNAIVMRQMELEQKLSSTLYLPGVSTNDRA